MPVIRRELASYTAEQVVAAVNNTVQIADDAELSTLDRAALLPAIFEKVAAKEVTYEQMGATLFDGIGRPQG